MLDVTLEVPLRAFPVRRRRKRGGLDDTRVEILRDAADGSALARAVASLEDHGDAGATCSRPFLELDKLDLKAAKLLLIALCRDMFCRLRLVRVLPCHDRHCDLPGCWVTSGRRSAACFGCGVATPAYRARGCRRSAGECFNNLMSTVLSAEAIGAPTQLMINGRWVDASDHETFAVEDPATGEV